MTAYSISALYRSPLSRELGSCQGRKKELKFVRGHRISQKDDLKKEEDWIKGQGVITHNLSFDAEANKHTVIINLDSYLIARHTMQHFDTKA